MLGRRRADWRETRGVIDKEAAICHISGRDVWYNDLDKVQVLSVFRHDCEVVLFLS